MQHKHSFRQCPSIINLIKWPALLPRVLEKGGGGGGDKAALIVSGETETAAVEGASDMAAFCLVSA